MLNTTAKRAGRAPQPGLRHVSAGLDAVMDRLAERTQVEAPDDPAVSTFAAMVAAIKRRDFRAAAQHRRDLNARFGFNVLVRPGAAGERT